MNRPRSNANKEDIIADLKRIALDLGKSPTWTQFMDLSDIPPSRVVKCCGLFNKALEAAGLPVNRKRAKKVKGYTRRGGPRSKHRVRKPVFTSRICNICDRKFQAEDDMRSCPVCTTTKKAADNRGGLSDSNYGIGYLT